MGIAMISVILYHMYCWPGENRHLSLFRYGYIGVDIFLFLSGFGLCFSIEKNSKKQFYLNRFRRIIPLYWLQIMIGLVIVVVFGGGNFPIERLPSLVGLPVIEKGLPLSNWYVSAIILFYLLFPWLYKVVRKHPLTTLISTNITVLLLLIVFPQMPWYYDCIVSRLSVFEIGIICYHNDVCVIKRTFIISAFTWCLSISYDISMFLTTSTFCPMLMLCFYAMHSIITAPHAKINAILQYIGRYSYEIFISNGSVAATLLYLFRIGYMRHLWEIVSSYIILSFIYGYIWIKISEFFNRRLIKQKK